MAAGGDTAEDLGSENSEESETEETLKLQSFLHNPASEPQLPSTVTVLETKWGTKVYVVGTAHFSIQSQEDVAKTISEVYPTVVMVELCVSRVNILELDEQTLLEEARNINVQKIKMSIKQSGVVQGVMHLLLLNLSAHLTKELGMAPGGEFRRAFREAQNIPGCDFQLGDRPIQVTLRRALRLLTWWQKIKLAWFLLTSKESITKEDVEKCKERDLLEEMLKEMTGEFPALNKVFVEERDIYLAHSLKCLSQPVPSIEDPQKILYPVVVGVVGIGHVPGIIANWDKECDIREIMRIPSASAFSQFFKWSFKAGIVCLLSWSFYKILKWASPHLI